MNGDVPMLYIKLEDDKSLVATSLEPIYRMENLSQKLICLIPPVVDDIDVMTATVYMNILLPDGTADIIMLDRADEVYSGNYLQYALPVSNRMTKFPGAVCVWLNIFSGLVSNPILIKSGECVLRIMDSKNMDDYLSDRIITALYQYKKQTDDDLTQMGKRIDSVGEDVDALIAEKADNLIFNEGDSTIQLVANGIPVGERIKVCTGDGKSISDMSITSSGDLVVFYTDGTYANLGRAVGADGKVYIPHVDEHKILSFTIEDTEGEIPEPVDLGPYDDWGDMDSGDDIDDIEGNGLASSYIWEDL